MDQFFGQSSQEASIQEEHSGISVLIAAADEVNKEISNTTTSQSW